MALFVTIDSFKGSYSLPRDSSSEEKLEEYLEEFEESFLIYLLGAELYSLFKQDYISENPTANQFSEDRFKAIFNPIALDNNRVIVRSEGIEVMLARFMYYEFNRDSNIKKNIGGNFKNKQADSEEASADETNLDQVYNIAVGSFNAIQYYMADFNPEGYNYDNFNGQTLTQNSLV